MSEDIKKYDKRGNLIYWKRDSWNKEYWYKYDENNNRIYIKDSEGFEYWAKYDDNNNVIYEKNNDDYESWYKHDEDNEKISITEREYKNIKIREYNSRTKCSRFELMEI